MITSKRLWLASVAASSILAATGAAQAGGFALREQSAIGLGNAFAGAAAGGSGLSSMFWNPATMTDIRGIQTSFILSGILPYAKISPTSGTSGALQLSGGLSDSGDMAQDAIVPASYASWQLNEKLWLGLSVNAPYGLATTNPFNWSGQLYGRTSKVSSINATPTIAYQLTDWLSVGAGVQIMKFNVRLTSANAAGYTNIGVLVPNSIFTNATTGELKGDDTAFGFTLGATAKPWAGGEIGVGYRSRVNPKLEGTFVAPGGNPTTGLAGGTYDIRSDLRLPDQVNVGVRQQLTNNITVLAGLEWTHWAKFSRFPVYTTANALATTLMFDYRDSWYASVGAEYAWNADLTLRAGLGLEKSPIKSDTRSVRLPDSDRTWTTIGASYKWDQKLSFDASYAHLFAKSGTISVTTPIPFAATTKGHVDIVSFGLTYRWDDAPKSVAKPVLVTKG